MKKSIFIIIAVLLCAQLSGCSGWIVRTKKTQKVRVDQAISGNRGFITGKPTAPPKEPTFTERDVYRIEIEIPQWSFKRKKKHSAADESAAYAPGKDKRLWGNKGYLFSKPKKAKETRAKAVPQRVKPEPQKPAVFSKYTVLKGDTLQVISQKFYGTTKNWNMLYQANKDVLKNPNSLYPGQVLIIPGKAK
jgi:LysM repeat protein